MGEVYMNICYFMEGYFNNQLKLKIDFYMILLYTICEFFNIIKKTQNINLLIINLYSIQDVDF
jgi:hypothetical protein